jgi:hypothetical protein
MAFFENRSGVYLAGTRAPEAEESAICSPSSPEYQPDPEPVPYISVSADLAKVRRKGGVGVVPGRRHLAVLFEQR